MNNQTLFAETAHIVRQLSRFDGAAAVNVVARCYPKFSPAQGGPPCDVPGTPVPLKRL